MKQIKLYLCLCLLLCISSCSKYDDSELWEKVNSIENRVNNLEQQLKTINSNISSISNIIDMLQQKKFIEKISVSENGYILQISDGSQIELRNGKDGKDGKDGENAPIINIKYDNGTYYWTQTINGVTKWLYDSSGNRIIATGKNGTTPLLKVDSDNYWTISYDNGNTYTKLLDANNQPISATSSDSYFESVEIIGNDFVIILKDGTELSIPIGSINPYRAIDLGLSVKWASMNLGATDITDFGKRYLWSDPSGEGVMFYFKSPELTDICGTKYDIVRKELGGKWRLPSRKEEYELATKCKWARATINGVTGMKVTGKNGNSIFLPPTGYEFPASGSLGTTKVYDSTNGYYWTGESKPYSEGYMAYCFSFNGSTYNYDATYNSNYVKLAIRPIKEKK